jgi:8-oxo-dGTP pyrophosphatase MutT (NUDIX family)
MWRRCPRAGSRSSPAPASTPPARTTLSTAFAAVRNGAGQVLVVRRFDGGNWDLPGGRIEVGETAGQAVIREVAKESGVRIALAGLSGDRYLSARSRASGRSE